MGDDTNCTVQQLYSAVNSDPAVTSSATMTYGWSRVLGPQVFSHNWRLDVGQPRDGGQEFPC